jgi:hypothetical protein
MNALDSIISVVDKTAKIKEQQGKRMNNEPN